MQARHVGKLQQRAPQRSTPLLVFVGKTQPAPSGVLLFSVPKVVGFLDIPQCWVGCAFPFSYYHISTLITAHFKQRQRCHNPCRRYAIIHRLLLQPQQAWRKPIRRLRTCLNRHATAKHPACRSCDELRRMQRAGGAASDTKTKTRAPRSIPVPGMTCVPFFQQTGAEA